MEMAQIKIGSVEIITMVARKTKITTTFSNTCRIFSRRLLQEIDKTTEAGLRKKLL